MTYLKELPWHLPGKTEKRNMKSSGWPLNQVPSTYKWHVNISADMLGVIL
jgi:hypothetical protein